MREAGIETGARAPQDRSPTVYCIIPARLSRIRSRLCEHFADDPQVEVVVEQRSEERRSRGDRRQVPDDGGSAVERRLNPGLERRRLGDRRAGTVPVERPPLPAELRRYADELLFVRQAPRAEAEVEFARATAEWRDRHREPEREARELAKALIGAIERLRRRRPPAARPLIAVLRAQRAIDRRRRGR
jgi:hypothetical protein